MIIIRMIFTVLSKREKPIEEQVTEALFNRPQSCKITIKDSKGKFEWNLDEECSVPFQMVTETFRFKLDEPITVESNSRKYKFRVKILLEGVNDSGSGAVSQQFYLES